MTSVVTSTLLLHLFLSTFTIFAARSVRIHEEYWEDMHTTKSGVLSIETAYGDIYDCIDVHKQDSLKHPALRNHKLEMKPQNFSGDFHYEANTRKSYKRNIGFDSRKLWKLKKGCPKGTVPIRREKNNSRDHFFPSLGQAHGVEFVGIYTIPSQKIYYSAGADINIANPKLCSDQTYSSATIFLESGNPVMQEQIQVGWMVNPQEYGDYRTRLYTSWTVLFTNSGCYNIKCQGFVIVSNQIPLDFAFDKISVSEGEQFELHIKVFRGSSGWWLAIRDLNPSSGWINVGYWPAELFKTMQDNADSVRFGGQVFTPASADCSPQMGNGVYKNGEYDKTCYMRNVKVTDETNVEIDVNNSFLGGVDSRCYLKGDYSYKNDQDRYSFDFGGHGGKDDMCFA